MKTIYISCPTCDLSFHRTARQVRLVVEKRGIWRCQLCAIAASNKARDYSTRIKQAVAHDVPAIEDTPALAAARRMAQGARFVAGVISPSPD